MSVLDTLVVSALIATVWVALYAGADRIVADVRAHPARPALPHLLRWARLRLAALRRRRRTR